MSSPPSQFITTSAPVSAQDALRGFGSFLSTYKHRIGHACHDVAFHLPHFLANKIPADGKVLDNGCGTGAVTEALLAQSPELEIAAIDIMPQMIEVLRSVVASNPSLRSQVKDMQVVDSQELDYPDASFDASVSNFAIFYFPDPVAGARQIYRTLKPGGVAIVTAWKTLGFKPILWEVQRRVGPAKPLTELPLVEPWCESELLETTLKEGGFNDVRFHVVGAALWGKDREDFEAVLVENFQAMVARDWTEEEKAKLPAVTTQVVEERRREFCIVDGDRLGCVMEAWVAVSTK